MPALRNFESSLHQEYWIPAEDLDEFNRNIMGSIEVISEYRPSEPICQPDAPNVQ